MIGGTAEYKNEHAGSSNNTTEIPLKAANITGKTIFPANQQIYYIEFFSFFFR